VPSNAPGGPRTGLPADGWDPDRDPSLAAERTQLAWNRSGLAVLAAVAIALRRLWPVHGTTGSVILTLTALGALTWAAGMVMTRRSGDGRPHLRHVHARTLTAGTLVLAAAGLALSLTS